MLTEVRPELMLFNYTAERRTTSLIRPYNYPIALVLFNLLRLKICVLFSNFLEDGALYFTHHFRTKTVEEQR